MSIEYYVEGKTTIQTEGSNLTFSKEDISYNSEKNVNQKGTDTGVSFNKPREIHPNDKPVNLLEVSLNLFFDGTQNNKTNTELGKDYAESNHDDDSYTNDLSNVARGFDAIDPNAENQVAAYIEGIGTEDKESETTLWGSLPNNSGTPLGTGDRGIEAKVAKGCKNGAEALKKYGGKKGIHLKVNVYGFSRGAAAARNFLHIANSSVRIIKMFSGKIKVHPPGNSWKPQESLIFSDEDGSKTAFISQFGYFGASLIYKNIKPEKITFNFVGLYDTVASFGLIHSDDTTDLGLDAVKKAYFVLQIAADDEYRDNFDSTNIDSASVKGLQFTLPGVHSDIGGCYVNGLTENVDIYLDNGNNPGSGARFRQILINEGWYKPQQIWLEKLTPAMDGIVPVYMLKGKRPLFNTYDKISLNTMFNISKQEQFGVKYDTDAMKDHAINDPFLIVVNNQLQAYMNACNTLRNSYITEYNKNNSAGHYLEKIKAINYEDYLKFEDLETLRNKYLHWSASVTKFGFDPKVGEVTNGKNRKRKIQPG